MEEPIDYPYLMAGLVENPAAKGPGVRCQWCNHPDNVHVPWQDGRIFHPAGRPCLCDTVLSGRPGEYPSHP